MRSSICRGGGSSHATSACIKSYVDDPAWAARYNTWLFIKYMPKGKVFPVLFFSLMTHQNLEYADPCSALAPVVAVHAAGQY